MTPTSGTLWLVHAHPLGASKERIQSRLQKSRQQRVMTAARQVPNTFPSGAIGLISQMSIAGAGGTKLGELSSKSQPLGTRHHGALFLFHQPGSSFFAPGGDTNSEVELVSPTPRFHRLPQQFHLHLPPALTLSTAAAMTPHWMGSWKGLG